MAHFLNNHQKSFDYIQKVVNEFYELAKNDIIIGYHFRHIDDFSTHLPKIYKFWALQLLELTSTEKASFEKNNSSGHIIEKHIYLKIKKGEIGRWILLFQKTLSNNTPECQSLRNLQQKWAIKTEVFHRAFVNSKKLFP